MKIEKRAEVALKMLQAAVKADDQDACDLLSNAVERDQLYRFYAADNGARCESMADFIAEMNKECGQPVGPRPTASADDTRPLCELTTEERFAARQAMAHAAQ